MRRPAPALVVVGSDRTMLMALFIDIRLCDSRYGNPLTPFPPQN